MRKIDRSIYPLLVFSALAAIFFGQACSPAFSTKLVDSSAESFASSQKRCAPPPGISGTPKTIEEAVSLINSLPKPVTIPCFLESLDRPLYATLTSSEQSAQPAVGERSPRIFIIIDKLFISIALDGRGQDFVEFSYRTSVDMTIKAELEFPIVQEVPASKPYDNVIYGYGTSCNVCHRQERPVASISFAQAFESKAIPPSPDTLVDLNVFKREAKKCISSLEPERCAIIQAFLGFGEVRSRNFPSDMPDRF